MTPGGVLGWRTSRRGSRRRSPPGRAATGRQTLGGGSSGGRASQLRRTERASRARGERRAVSFGRPAPPAQAPAAVSPRHDRREGGGASRAERPVTRPDASAALNRGDAPGRQGREGTRFDGSRAREATRAFSETAAARLVRGEAGRRRARAAAAFWEAASLSPALPRQTRSYEHHRRGSFKPRAGPTCNDQGSGEHGRFLLPPHSPLARRTVVRA